MIATYLYHEKNKKKKTTVIKDLTPTIWLMQTIIQCKDDKGRKKQMFKPVVVNPSVLGCLCDPIDKDMNLLSTPAAPSHPTDTSLHLLSGHPYPASVFVN